MQKARRPSSYAYYDPVFIRGGSNRRGVSINLGGNGETRIKDREAVGEQVEKNKEQQDEDLSQRGGLIDMGSNNNNFADDLVASFIASHFHLDFSPPSRYCQDTRTQFQPDSQHIGQ